MRVTGDGLAVTRHAPGHGHQPRAERVPPGTDPVTMEARLESALVLSCPNRVANCGRQKARLCRVDQVERRELFIEQGSSAKLRY